ncbi:MAG TPA: sigma-70 family RNA polymerase sigma factor [Sphingobium sp.]|nr:sigma-70 family RNA polymerase sigma factor [Sphingobium sp.]
MRWLKSHRDDAILEDLQAMQRYARSLTRDRDDAEDVVQDALVRAMERHETYQPGRDRRRWLLAIVRNAFISGKRRVSAEARRRDSFAETLMQHVEPDQEQLVRLAQVARGFAALPDHHRSILHLIAVEGLSYQETAQVLDLPIGTVMSRLARARAALRRMEDLASADSQQAGNKLRLVGEEHE